MWVDIKTNKLSPIEKVYMVLTTADRIGADKDEPEGSKYIIISDTLAQGMATMLKPYIKNTDNQSLNRNCSADASQSG